VRALSFGPAPRTEEVLRSALALGCDAATWLEHPTDLAPDALLTAKALSHGLSRYPCRLLLAGKQAGDDEEGLVLPMVAELRGLPGPGFVTNLRWEAAAGRFTFDRAVEGGTERYSVPPPLAIGLQQAWNDPRTAKLPNILKSRRAPIDRIAWAELAEALGDSARPRSHAISFRLPAPRTGARKIEYKTPEEAASELVRILREEAKVFP
jgi:electron transfer flavoprotein beta subunit